MVEGWNKIYSSDHRYQAALIKELLEEYNLHPVVLDRKDQEFLVGEAEVYVAPEETEKALQVIRDNQKPA